jgi:serine/threonine-protein kinase RsbW
VRTQLLETITFERDYRGRADQVRHVRRDVAEHLGECPVADDVILIASEVAANAVLHSRSRGGHFTIRVKLYGDYVRLECQDAGGAWRGRRHTADRPHGLDIVDALTGPDHWDTERTPDGARVVWATLEWPGRTKDLPMTDTWETAVRTAANTILRYPDKVSDGLEAELYALLEKLSTAKAEQPESTR